MGVGPELDALSCFSSRDEGGDAGGGSNRFEKIVVPILAAGAAVVLLLIFLLIMLFRHRRHQQASAEKEAAMQQQMSDYQAQLEKEKEVSKNEKAELQKMRQQYRMLAMDLLANTAGSGSDGGTARDKAPSGEVCPLPPASRCPCCTRPRCLSFFRCPCGACPCCLWLLSVRLALQRGDLIRNKRL